MSVNQPQPVSNKPIDTKSIDPLSSSIALLSLIVSVIVAYVSYFRQSNIKLLLGRNIIFFSIPIATPGSAGNVIGTGFNLPISFYNWSPQGGTIQRVRLVVGRQNDNDFYDMTWATFVKIGSVGNFEDENLAQPIPVEGRSSVNNSSV